MSAAPAVAADAIDFDLAESQAIGNALLDRLAAMRDVAPIYRSDLNGGAWIVTGHAEVTAAFAGRVPLSAVRLPQMIVGAVPEPDRMKYFPYLMTSPAHWLVNMDRPAQSRVRHLAQKAFSARMAEDLRPFVRASIKAAFDDVAELDQFEFTEAIARRVTGRTILHLLGLPETLMPNLRDWALATTAAFTSVNMPTEVLVEGERVLLEMRGHFLQAIAARRKEPGEDFISALVTSRAADGDALGEEEILGMLYLALVAGHDTTANSMALGTAALATLPDALGYIRTNPDRIGDVVMEISRYVAMSTMQGRIAAEDFDWGGHSVRRGDLVLIFTAGANRDPKVFDQPDTFDPTRSQAGNVTFGPGLHFCIGHYLAKMQLQEYFSALAARFDPEVLDDKLHFAASLGFRGLESLNVRFRPRA